MAERRMLSKKIVSSAKFLKMPVSSRELYFQLNINADDDGIVEAFTVMNMVKANEDDLKVLVAKNFVSILNEDLVTYILDWNENNLIRADRKVDSIYKDLLIQVLPDAKIKEKKERADLKKNKNATNGQPNDNQWTSNGQHKIREDKIIEDNISNNSITSNTLSSSSEDNYDKECKSVFDFWNDAKIIVHKSYTPKLEKLIKEKISFYGINKVREAILNYARVYFDKNYFFSYKWKLEDFLKQNNAMPSFFNEGEKWLNYIGVGYAQVVETSVDDNGGFTEL